MALGDNSILDRLNPAERDILVLLAQGHTAKSIADVRGVSVASVNERLRSARRKTGVGSSRELARLVSAQENRHDLIGLAPAPASPPPSPRPDAPLRRASPLRRWSLPVIATALVAAAALFAQQTAAPPAGAGQAVVGDILSNQQKSPDMASLHAEASDGVDPAWSPGAETTLRRHFEAILTDRDDVQSFDVVCGASLCEVAGSTRLDVTGAQVSDLLRRLQDPAGGRTVPGMEQHFAHYGSSTTRPGTFVFVSYWRRT